jgi:hypothetical protein
MRGARLVANGEPGVERWPTALANWRVASRLQAAGQAVPLCRAAGWCLVDVDAGRWAGG